LPLGDGQRRQKHEHGLSTAHPGATHRCVAVSQPSPSGHGPQSSGAPHPSSGSVPQSAPKPSQVLGVQPQWLGMPLPPQLVGGVQGPQSRTWPHPSLANPHAAAKSAQVRAAQPWASSEHCVGPLPMHTDALCPWPCSEQSVPQLSTPPQPSRTVPHSAPRSAQAFGVHPHWFGPPTPQVSGGVQEPPSAAGSERNPTPSCVAKGGHTPLAHGLLTIGSMVCSRLHPML